MLVSGFDRRIPDPVNADGSKSVRIGGEFRLRRTVKNVTRAEIRRVSAPGRGIYGTKCVDIGVIGGSRTCHDRKETAVIVRIEEACLNGLLEIVETVGGARFFARLVQRRQQHGGENRYNCYNHKEFDKRKAVSYNKSYVKYGRGNSAENKKSTVKERMKK